MTVTTKIAFKDFWSFYWKNFLLKPLPMIAFIVLIAYFIKQLINAFEYGFNWISVLIPLIFPLFVVFFIFKAYSTSKKAFLSNKKIQEENTYTFTPEKIVIKGETFESEYSWNSIYQIRELKDWFLIYQSLQVMNMVPKKDFTREQVSELRSIITNNGVKAKLRND
ncbi:MULTISPECIES: YcxB family protein [unclassified Chryseobacterium]|uniref:YcxB family protein n=1 Tax=unclassified Chryseobacterium TaxID=2593645 RepID=UPI000F45ABE8|nr:YcxB family protein [Chryseobacterium sp. G0240]ROI06464.1 YcxB family protein [Chryseobacterium sp. G0240]